jgi:dihydrofolate reductase
MGNVILDLSMSLDGFAAGLNPTLEEPLGVGGERLHKWMFENQTPTDAEVQGETMNRMGAVLVGWNTYRDGIDTGWGGVSPFPMPAFVVCRQQPDRLIAGFTYVSDGIESALKQARAAAGDKDVWLMGGPTLAQAYLKAGLIDELHIHVVPVLFCQGKRLFDHIGTEQIELERTRIVESPGATHLYFRVLK